MHELEMTPTTSTHFSTSPSPVSDNSEATELESSTSIPEESLTETESGPPRLSGLRYNDRTLVLGKTWSGKSQLAKRLFLSTPLTWTDPSDGTLKRAQRCVIDPADSELTASVAEVTFSDPKRVPDAATVRFVPNDPEDSEAFNVLYRHFFYNFPAYIWLDETEEAMPAKGYPKAASRYLVQGRKRALGHLACNQRPRDICKKLISQAEHIFIFELGDPEDVKYVASLVGLAPADVINEMAALPEYGFLYLDRRAKHLAACDPLPLEK